MPQTITTVQLPIHKDYPSNIYATVVRPIEFATLEGILAYPQALLVLHDIKKDEIMKRTDKTLNITARRWILVFENHYKQLK